MLTKSQKKIIARTTSKLGRQDKTSPAGNKASAPIKTRIEFSTSGRYWEERYQRGRTSGSGSYGRLAEFKADILNSFVTENKVSSVIEFGSGDGNQLTLAKYPEYLGVDVAQTAIDVCRLKFSEDPSKAFVNLADYNNQKAELSLSLDVIFHLVEDETFERYMETLFNAATRFVIIYSSNRDEQPPQKHVRHRHFTAWVDANCPAFRNIGHIPNRHPFDPKDPENTSFAEFYIFERTS